MDGRYFNLTRFSPEHDAPESAKELIHDLSEPFTFLPIQAAGVYDEATLSRPSRPRRQTKRFIHHTGSKCTAEVIMQPEAPRYEPNAYHSLPRAGEKLHDV